jgi:hypothetical protein
LRLHVHRQRLGPSFDSAGDDADGAELADRAGSRENHAVRDGPTDRWERDLAEGLERRGAERLGRLLLLRPVSRRTGTTSRTTNGSDTNIVASTMPGTANRTLMPWPASSEEARLDGLPAVQTDPRRRDREEAPPAA